MGWNTKYISQLNSLWSCDVHSALWKALLSLIWLLSKACQRKVSLLCLYLFTSSQTHLWSALRKDPIFEYIESWTWTMNQNYSGFQNHDASLPFSSPFKERKKELCHYTLIPYLLRLIDRHIFKLVLSTSLAFYLQS